MADIPFDVYTREIGIRERRVGELEAQLEAKEEELRKLKPWLAIRKKIQVYEALLAPEL